MAHTARLLRFLLISVIILVNVETKKHTPISKRARSTSKPHTYPHSYGGSGGGRHTTSAPQRGNTHHPYITTTSRPYIHHSTRRPDVWKPVTSAPTLGYTPYPQIKPTSGSHTYPLTSGGSGSGFKPILDPRTGSYSRPSTTNTGISTINLNTGHTTGHISYYNNHVYVRNQPTTYYTSNTRTTHIYHYPYNPPHRIHYTNYGNQVLYYPVYTGQLPNYVFEYRASKSRYSKLLAGLALYNLGRMTRNNEVRTFHNTYQPRPDEMCLFSVYYDEYRSDEMEVDCRLMTDFIWTENKLNQPGTVSENSIVLPNGTLVLSYTQIAPKGVINALDPRLNGDYVHVTRNMKCYIIWTVSYTSPRRKEVECALLQHFVDKSMNSATTVTSRLVIILSTVAVFLFY